MRTPITAIEIDDLPDKRNPVFSICTLVTDKQRYDDMLASFHAAGFTDEDCEYLYIDNTALNKYDAYSGAHAFFNVARGQYIILCHQDLLLHDHKRDRLEDIIEEMDQIDPDWALLGNAGGIAPGKLAVRITDHFYGNNVTIGTLPARVYSLDENFIVIKREANITISKNLFGFHFYGTDLCLLADIIGYSAYVVDFHLHHICGDSARNVGIKFDESSPLSFNNLRKGLIAKYQNALAPRWLQTTCTMMFLSGSRLRNLLSNHKQAFSLQKRLHRWFRR